MTKTELKSKLINTGLVEENEYFKKYVDLIYNNRLNKFDFLTSQCHHIVPRCYYKYTNQKIDNSKSNLVNLKYKDHLLAHYYLCLCCKDNDFFYLNFLALRIVISTLPNQASELKKQENEIIKDLERIQEIYEKSKSYIKKRDLSFYDKVNTLRSEGKTSKEISDFFKISYAGISSKYHNICIRNKLKAFKYAFRWWGDDTDFYNRVNELAKQGILEGELSKHFKKSAKSVIKKYNEICKNNKWRSIYHLEKYKLLPNEKKNFEIILEKKAEFEEIWNENFDSTCIKRYINDRGIECAKVDMELYRKKEMLYLIESTGLTEEQIKNLLWHIPFKKGKINRFFINKTNEEIEIEEKSFVNRCNQYLSNGKYWPFIANVIGGNPQSLRKKYYRILKKYNLKESNNIQKPTKNEIAKKGAATRKRSRIMTGNDKKPISSQSKIIIFVLILGILLATLTLCIFTCRA